MSNGISDIIPSVIVDFMSNAIPDVCLISCLISCRLSLSMSMSCSIVPCHVQCHVCFFVCCHGFMFDVLSVPCLLWCLLWCPMWHVISHHLLHPNSGNRQFWKGSVNHCKVGGTVKYASEPNKIQSNLYSYWLLKVDFVWKHIGLSLLHNIMCFISL